MKQVPRFEPQCLPNVTGKVAGAGEGAPVAADPVCPRQAGLVFGALAWRMPGVTKNAPSWAGRERLGRRANWALGGAKRA